MSIHLSSEPDASQADLETLENNIYAFNMQIHPEAYYPIRIFLRDEAGQLRGGITGGCWGGWFHINFLWVDEDLRKQSFGSQLLKAAENDARGHGCKGVFLETHSFQAPEFYTRHGYKVVGVIPDYPAGYRHEILLKWLVVI